MHFAEQCMNRVVLNMVLLKCWATFLFPGPAVPLTEDDFASGKQVYFRRLAGI